MRPATLPPALDGIHVASYLVHSMEPGAGSFAERDREGAANFAAAASAAGVERIVYLGGLGDDARGTSEHLASRHETGRALAAGGPPVLELRAAMVVAPESASFRMLMDLVRRLPAMVVPRWVDTPSQPIAAADVVAYLASATTARVDGRHVIVEIGGPDVVTYRDMIRRAASRTGRSPLIIGVPLLSPRLSSYWTGLTTSVSAAVARPLIEGMSTALIVRDPEPAARIFPDLAPMPFDAALERALADMSS
jgi:uncharacterized protein YbjT (DUF2867 family)